MARAFDISRRDFLKHSGLAIAGLGLAGCASRAGGKQNDKPLNIIHILIDDLGYADLGCYGNEFCETPNIDRLASQGLKFTSGYSASAICSPARASFMTGKTPARLNFEFVTKDEDMHFDWNDEWRKQWADWKLTPPPFTINMPLEEVTIPERLKAAGYVSGITGKWHCAGHHGGYNGWSNTYGPLQQGFDWGTETRGAHPYGYKKSEKGKFGDYKEGEFPEDELTQKAIQFMKENKEGPFFLFVSHYYVHDPLGTKCEWLLKKYQAKAERMGLDYSDKRILYAAFVETMDHYVGQLLDAIDEQGLTDDTLLVFTSDNGGHPVHAFNAPLRGSKWNLYEGGIRVPFMVRWPGVTKPGTATDVPVVATDLLQTYCDVTGVKVAGESELDGQSIRAVIENPKSKKLDGRALYWHFPYYHWRGDYFKIPAKIGINDGYISQTKPQSAIRQGDYKLIYFYEDGNVELYNLEKDLSEQNDLGQTMPEKAAELKAKLLGYLEKVDARLPRRNPW